MTEIRKIVVCDICGKEITPSMLKWRSTGARLRFYKRDFIDRPGQFNEYDVCEKCWKRMFDACRNNREETEK